MVEHEAEIYGRPARTWFQSEKEKAASKGTSLMETRTDVAEAGKSTYVSSFPGAKEDPKNAVKKDGIKRGKYEGLSRKQTRRRLALEQDDADNNSKTTAAAVRKAKKENRPGKITEPLQKPSTGKSKSKKKPSAGPAKAGAGGKKRSSAFDEERGAKKGRSSGDGHEGMRAKRVKVNLSKGPKSKGRSKK